MLEDKISIIIPCAGESKFLYPKSLVKLINGDSVLSRQIKILHNTFRKAEIILVCGYQYNKISDKIPSFVNLVINNEYDLTGPAYSIMMGIKTSSNKKILIIHGDLVFHSDTFNKDTIPSCSTAWINNKIKKDGVGILSENNKVLNFSYGIPNKWNQIVYLKDKELEIFSIEAEKKKKSKFCTHEILNDIIKAGGSLDCKISKSDIIEINSQKDIIKANKITYEDIMYIY